MGASGFDSVVGQLPPLERRTISAVIADALERHPSRVAVRDPERALTYEDLASSAGKLAAGVEALGVVRGDPVLHMLDNHLDHVVVWTGLGLSGIVSVPVNTSFIGEMLAHVINDSAASTIVIEAKYVGALLDVADALTHLKAVVVRGYAQDAKTRPSTLRWVPFEELSACGGVTLARLEPWQTHSVMYTSGTTGDSKGVLVSQAQTFTRAAVVRAVAPSSSHDEVSLVTLPLFHVVGQCRGLYGALIHGASAVVLPRFSVSGFWPAVHRYQATYTSLLGSMATFLFKQRPAEHDRGHRLHSVVMAPTIPDVHAFAARFGVRVIASYGSTEAGSVTTSLADGDDCGMLHPEFEACIADEHDRELPEGEVGELLLRARHPWLLSAGYLGRPQASMDLWRNGWLHTGDSFQLGGDGRLRFVGRRKDTIRRRGENISAAEVERAAVTHPLVVECVAVAVPSEDMEEEVKLVAVVSGDLAEQDLVVFLAERLPYFMVPRYVAFVERLPMTATNKVDKRALAQDDPAMWDRQAVGLRVTRDGVLWETAPEARA